jgi:hypothetical protein
MLLIRRGPADILRVAFCATNVGGIVQPGEERIRSSHGLPH